MVRALAVGAIAIGVAGPQPASAAPIASVEYVETSLGGGLFRYDYVFDNLADPVADAGADLYWLSFSFSPLVSATADTLPTNWDAITGDGFISTFSLVPGAAPGGTDIGPGQVLGGFSFVLNGQIGSSGFEALFSNVLDPSNPLVYEGLTTERPSAPTPVPEPASLLLIGVGLSTLVAARRPRR